MFKYKHKKRAISLILSFTLFSLLFFQGDLTARAEITISCPSAILIEASTGKVIYELNADEERCPASITKIMTLLLIFEALDSGKISLEDEVVVSQYASSMGGSQVFLAENETQTVDTMIKCIAVASGNDASVAMAEYIGGTEEAFVDMMNSKAKELGMENTHFEDCCGLTDSDGHYTSARDISIMSRELITKYPKIYDYTTIWSEDITHETNNGSSIFTLNSTNKLLKQYQWTTGLKTGSTSKAKFCMSATARKDGIDLIAVVMAAQDQKCRFADAQTLLGYGYNVCKLYKDNDNSFLHEITVRKGKDKLLSVSTEEEFRYVDIEGNNLDTVERIIEMPEEVTAPVKCGDEIGNVKYMFGDECIGSRVIYADETIEQAGFNDYFIELWHVFLF